MKNEIFEKLKSVIQIKVTGKRLDRFLKRLMSHEIELLEIKYPKRNEALINIYKKDYEKVMEIKSIYEIVPVDSFGAIKIKKTWKKNQIFIFLLLLGVLILYGLSQVIFQIEVIHTDKEIRTLLLKELAHYGIEEKKLKKSFDRIETIKKEILNKHKDKIEWLEIENVGTKYIVRVEVRKLKDDIIKKEVQHIIAKKSAVIKRVEAKSGEIIRNVDDYVVPGDIIISGEIKLNEEVKGYTSADGKVYGEVWYQTKVDYPLAYQEEYETGKRQNALVLKFLSHEFDVTFHPFEKKRVKETVLLKSNWIPFSLVYQKQAEVVVSDAICTEDEAIDKALQLAKKKMEDSLKEEEKVLKQSILNITLKEDRVILDVFFAVLEEIGEVQVITMEEEKND